MPAHSPVRLLLTGLLLWSGWACTDTPVAIVDVADVDIEPAAVSLTAGESRQLQARVTDAAGNVLTGRPVQWSSAAADVAAVDANGLILGLGAGTAIITAESAGVRGTAQISVSAVSVIVAEPDSVRLEAVTGETDLAASVGITNGGGGTLTGLSVSVEYGAGASAWLAVALSGTTAPAALDLAADATDLTPGSWRASVRVASSLPGVAPAVVPVVITVVQANPAPSLVSVTPDRGAREQAINVIMTGDGFVEGLTTVSFGPDISVDAVTVEGPTTLTAGITIGPSATTGTRDVVVVNPAPGGGADTLANSFAIIGAVAADVSSVTADPASGVPADGSAASTVAVHLRDSAGSAVAGMAPDAFEVSATGSAATGNISEGATPGAYSFEVTNTVAETVTIAVQADGVALTETPTIQFVVGPAAQVSITTQPSTSAQAWAVFAQQPVIQLVDAAGNAVARAGVVVGAAIATGGGTLGGTLAATTSASGAATFTDLSISGTIGERRLRFTAQGMAPDTSSTISITAGAPDRITLYDGDAQSATVGTVVSVAPAVLVTDASDNPIADMSVTFAITAGGGSLAGSGLVSTDAHGVATSPAWTLGPAPGDNTLTAAATGLAGSPVTFAAIGTVPEGSAVRIVTFGDSNTDYGYASATSSSIVARSYVSNRITGRLAPTDVHHANQLAGLIEARWAALESSDITAVNHGIGGTTSGGGIGGGSNRHPTSAPHARTVVDGITRYEAEVLGKGYPWSGGEAHAVEFPDGGIVRVNSFSPAANDFAYVSIGTNDQSSGVSVEQTIANLTWMVDTWLAEGLRAEQFIITTLAPRPGTAGDAFPQINSEIRALAAARGIRLVDLAAYTSDDNGATWKSADLHVGDELHYTVAVRAWIADQIVAHMRSTVTPDMMISGRE